MSARQEEKKEEEMFLVSLKLAILIVL